MNNTRVGLGLAAWTLGILVPVMHHVLLHWPIAQHPTPNVVTRIEGVFRSLPWIDWAFLIAMAVVGAMLIVSGMSRKHQGSA